MWCSVWRDDDGDDRAWCGHQHASAQEASECQGPIPECEEWDWYVLEDYDPEANAPCVHLLHPTECDRCSAARDRCPHLGDPRRCVRCLTLNFYDIGVSYDDTQD